MRTPEPAGHVPWLELFYDLAFVGVVTVLADDVNPLSSTKSEGWTFIAAASLFFVWLATTLSFNKYPPRDDPTSLADSMWRAARRILVFVQMVGVVIVVLAVNQGPTGVSDLYGLLALGTVVLTVAALFIVSPLIHGERSGQLAFASVLLVCGGLILIIAAWASTRLQLAAYSVALVLLIVAVIVFIHESTREIRFDHLQERFGLIVIIVLGESILTLALGFAATDGITDIPLFALAMFFPMAVFEMYFKLPAIVANKPPPIYLWIFVQFLLVFSIGAAGHSLSGRAVDPSVLNEYGATEHSTLRPTLVLIALCVLSLIARRITQRVAIVYAVTALIIVGIAWWGVAADLKHSTLLAIQVVVFIIAAAVGSAIAGVARRAHARDEELALSQQIG